MAPWRLWVKSEVPGDLKCLKAGGGSVCFECPVVDLGYLQDKVDLQGLSPRFPWGSC